MTLPAASSAAPPPPPALPARAGWRARLGRWAAHLGVMAGVLVVAHLWQTRHLPTGQAPAFNAPAVASQPGAMMSLAQWRAAHPGRAVALHFWAEWCGICRLEQHNISAISADWPVLSVAMRSGDQADVRRVLAQRGLNWATVTDADAAIARRYGLGSVPAFIVIAPDGRISAASIGYTTEWGMRLRLWWASR